ncbi:MAG: hypothetical protein K2P14_09095 [Anaeroplasmataceae bacterium]|nr:hypothetical protein [Anaeroplasmataceae bacterium]
MKKVAKIIFAAIAVLSLTRVGMSVWKHNGRIDNSVVITPSIDDGNSREGIFIF